MIGILKYNSLTNNYDDFGYITNFHIVNISDGSIVKCRYQTQGYLLDKIMDDVLSGRNSYVEYVLRPGRYLQTYGDVLSHVSIVDIREEKLNKLGIE